MYKIVLTHPQETAEIEEKFIPEGATLEIKHSPTEEDLIKNLQDVDAVISAYEPFTAKVMDALPKLKIISQAAIGFNSVDIKAAAERGIAVLNNPSYCTPEVADHTMALILTLDRRIKEFDKNVQEDKEWRYDLCKDVTRLSEQTLGLFGFGNIAREVAKRANAFGMKIIASDPYMNMELAKQLNVEVVTMEELMERSDIISIHAPLTDETKGYFTMEKYNMMKKKPLIINAGRGAIINEDCLAKALDEGLVRGAGLDVLEEEDPDLRQSKLVGRNNVIITPHVAYYSQTSQYEIQKLSAQNIDTYLKGEYDKLSIVNGVRK
ncbi:C-terminal binding protein [Tissierella sp. MB52-C2]|uniref:C-terminal binding protein n=1 Tax=Tissierella sp. MB52-C2 TaxID=3070999 RepID=UPI00280B096E|nr:C-terminal binding protein [Tissierella sp. MB52-C2]WMM24365.1 C-terminal binding protein [Tissierella sp. MB52-C2]